MKRTEKCLETRRVYSTAYCPFAITGVHRAVAADVECTGPYDIGHGYQGWLVNAPNGQTRVAEAETGGFIADSISAARRDVAAGDPAEQAVIIEKGHVAAKSAKLVDTDEFWKVLHMEAPAEAAIQAAKEAK